MKRNVCKACLKKHGLLQNFEKFVKNECTKCGKVRLCQSGRHRIWDMKAFFDNAQPKYKVIRNGVKYV